jgi:hypothetical protein
MTANQPPAKADQVVPQSNPFSPPAALVRPRNGAQKDNALNTDQHSDPTGGGKVGPDGRPSGR